MKWLTVVLAVFLSVATWHILGEEVVHQCTYAFVLYLFWDLLESKDE